VTAATLADIARATHIRRDGPYEAIVGHVGRAVIVPTYPGVERVPYAHVNEWARLETIRWEDD